MRLNTNLNSLNIYRNQKENFRANSQTLNRIVSGKKILNAKDDPNKIGQSNTLKIKIKSLEASSRNVQDANSMIQSIDGNMSAISDSIIRMKELVVKGANGSSDEDDRKIIQKEINSIKDGIDELVNGSKFNGSAPINDLRVDDNKYPAYLTLMTGAESGDVIKLKTYNLSTEYLKDKDGNTLKEIDITKEENIGKVLTTIDEVLGFVNEVRGEFGAIQNRLENSSEYLIESVGLNERAMSNISDADIAEEIVEFSRTSILNNASMSLIAQSNNLPKEILNILQRIK